MSPSHSLFSADPRMHLHPLSLLWPISGTATIGSASVRTSLRGWVITLTGGGGGAGLVRVGEALNVLVGRV